MVAVSHVLARETGAKGRRWWRWSRRIFPVLVSVGLIGWLMWRITPSRLLEALRMLDWPWLVLATLGQLVVLFSWDTFSLWWLFSQPDRRLLFGMFLRARADAMLWSAINLELGQGVFAAQLALTTGWPITEALGRCLLLALFDTGTLMSLGFVASFLNSNPVVAVLRWICLGIVLGLVLLALGLQFAPRRWRSWLEGQHWAGWLNWWTWQRSVSLAGQRLVMFLLVLLYAGIGLAICGTPADLRTVVGTIPFVIIAESLPGTGGLGERETALVYLLGGEGQAAVLLSFGLIWSTVVILGRIAIGLVSALLPRRDSASALHPV